ncbi:MAG: hypothetical protein KAJ16_13455, partial [Calditrichia bacterium]|nr:hypothetical protein [Calditrichia bacterium]
MKTSILLIMLTTVLMGNAQKNSAKITIHSIPDQVQIRVNSVIVGITPIIDYEVESGYISIEAISNETGIWNNHNIVQEIFVTPGQDTTIQIK